MSKLVLDDTVSGYNLQIINNNFDKIEQEFQDKVLYRNNPTGEPNALETDIDANGKRIINLPAPASDSEPVRLQDLTAVVEGRGVASLVTFEPYKSSVDEYVTVVENIAALRVFDPADSMYVQTKGYHTAQDGGAGMYYYDAADTTTPEDAGSVIVANGGERWKLITSGVVYAEQFGAYGDLVNDDRVVLQSAINYCSANKLPLLLRKQYLISGSLLYKNGTVIRGVTAKVNADTDQGSGFTDTSFGRQPILALAEGITGLRNNTTETLVGVCFENFGIVPVGRVNQDLPPYHNEAAFSVNTIGIDLSYTTDTVVKNVTCKGLDAGFFTSVSDRVCHRPVLDGVGGYSCNNFINFSSANTNYCAADVLITNVTMVRMMNNTLAMNYVDGITIANCKFFQAAYNNVQINNSPFVNISGSTFFETKLDNVYIQNSVYVSISGTLIARAGWYAFPLFSNKVANLKLEGCNAVNVDAVLERAAGYNYEIINCGDVMFRAQTFFAWYSTGGFDDGKVEGSFGVTLDVRSARNNTNNNRTGTVLLSNSQVDGALKGNQPWALRDGDTLDMDTASGIVLWERPAAGLVVGPGGSLPIVTKYVTVRPGWSARVRNIDYDSDQTIRLRVNSYFSNAATTQDREVPTTESGATIFTNSGAVPVRLEVTMYIYNPSGGTITHGAGFPLSASVEVAP